MYVFSQYTPKYEPGKLLRAQKEGRTEEEIDSLRQALEAAQAEAQAYVEAGAQ